MFLAESGFNPIEHLYDRYTVWVSYWGAHGTEFIHAWNEKTPPFLHLSQHVIMMLIASAIMLLGFSYATFARNTRVPKGLRNFLEPIVMYFRDEVVRPSIKNPHLHAHHHHDRDRRQAASRPIGRPYSAPTHRRPRRADGYGVKSSPGHRRDTRRGRYAQHIKNTAVFSVIGS